MQSNPTDASIHEMYPHSGSFTLTKENPIYPKFSENIYLLMRGFNAVKVYGSSTNAEIMLIWNIDRRYGTELWKGAEDEIDDTLVFPFRDNNGTITFEGKATEIGKDWKAELEFEFTNLTQEKIEHLQNTDSS